MSEAQKAKITITITKELPLEEGKTLDQAIEEVNDNFYDFLFKGEVDTETVGEIVG